MNKNVKEAMKHSNKLGAGAEKRRKMHLTSDEKKEAIMAEFKNGTLHSGSGEIVTDLNQALAIALSESGYKKKSKKSK